MKVPGSASTGSYPWGLEIILYSLCCGGGGGDDGGDGGDSSVCTQYCNLHCLMVVVV